MTPSGELETIRCLLCRGVVCYTPDDDSRYKDHLNVEHRVFYYMSWIIEKTVKENCKEEIGAQSLSLPNLTITPIHKIKSSTNGYLPSASTSSFTSRPSPSTTIQTEEGDGVLEEEAGSELSVFPILLQDQQGHAEEDISLDDSVRNKINIQNETKSIKQELQEMADDSMGYMEAKIITIRVQGQRQGGRKMYKCSLCPNIKPWPTVHKAERHRITHIPLAFRKMFQCPQCKERFIKEKNVKRHLDSGLCQGPKDHPCTVCGEIFQSKFDLQLHEESHEQLLKRHRCRLCGAKFNKLKYLNKHIMSHSNRKPYKCDICGKSFKSEYYVKTHRNAHFSDGSGLLTPSSSSAMMPHHFALAGGMLLDDDAACNMNEEGEEEENGNYDDEDIDIEEHLAPQIDLIEDESEMGIEFMNDQGEEEEEEEVVGDNNKVDKEEPQHD